MLQERPKKWQKDKNKQKKVVIFTICSAIITLVLVLDTRWTERCSWGCKKAGAQIRWGAHKSWEEGLNREAYEWNRMGTALEISRTPAGQDSSSFQRLWSIDCLTFLGINSLRAGHTVGAQ